MNNKEAQPPAPPPPFAVGDCVIYCGRRVVVLRYQWEFSEAHGWSWHYVCSGLPLSLVGASSLALARLAGCFAAPHFKYGDRVRYSVAGDTKVAHVVRVYAYRDDGTYNSMAYPGWIYALDDGTEWPQPSLRLLHKKDDRPPMTPMIKSYRVHTVTYDDGLQSLSATIPKDKRDVRIHGPAGDVVTTIPVEFLRRVLEEIDGMP